MQDDELPSSGSRQCGGGQLSIWWDAGNSEQCLTLVSDHIRGRKVEEVKQGDTTSTISLVVRRSRPSERRLMRKGTGLSSILLYTS